MKIASKNYAKLLVEAAESGQSLKSIAKRFWYALQKNKQYRNLAEILEAVDQEYAKKNGLVLTYTYSGTELPENQLRDIKARLKERFNKDVLVKNIIKNNITAGVVVKVDDKEIDLSLDGKIKRLKVKLLS